MSFLPTRRCVFNELHTLQSHCPRGEGVSTLRLAGILSATLTNQCLDLLFVQRLIVNAHIVDQAKPET